LVDSLAKYPERQRADGGYWLKELPPG